jgi:hypothetical protein
MEEIFRGRSDDRNAAFLKQAAYRNFRLKARNWLGVMFSAFLKARKIPCCYEQGQKGGVPGGAINFARFRQ